MDIQQILALENKNTHKIYLYIDLVNNLFIAYEFSAYLLTKLFDTLELKAQKLTTSEEEVVYTTRIPDRLAVKTFTGHNTTVSEQYIKVVLDDIIACTRWRVEFNKRKKEIDS
ncbi:hypothetical protein [Parabacteroides chongii]|uniref:hypothetical protein n=1 Tax=Parabacteroides chongii TaxID=2685834 RepID=UPI00101DF5C5|nr:MULTISPECIES: hypothetical protein [Parabacteroides]WFE84399.1 hypothetical protein P3L47_20025 [Parabacteroides chongii]